MTEIGEVRSRREGESFEHEATEDETIAALQAEVAELRGRIDAVNATHRAEIDKLHADHEAHLRRIEHGECISTATHKRICNELREIIRARQGEKA
jgi:hypothetical protein